MRPIPSLVLVWLVALPAPALAREAAEVQACALEARPTVRTAQTVRMTARDRIGSASERRALVYSGQLADGPRAVWIRFLSPSDLEGSEVLLVEQDRGLAQVFVSLDARGLLRMRASGRGGALFGTDFSPEDLARLYGLNRPGESRLLEPPPEGVDALETRPAEGARSAYGRVVSYVERERCVVVRASLYDRQDAHRKELVADPRHVERVGDGWLPRDVRMRDLRDGSETRLVVESVESGARVRALPFRSGDLPGAPPRRTDAGPDR